MADPYWGERAACRGMAPLEPDAPDLFFDFDPRTVGDHIAWEARLTCAACPVIRECLTMAFENEHTLNYGVFGGTLPKQRLLWMKSPERVDLLLEEVALYASRMRPDLLTQLSGLMEQFGLGAA